MTNADELRRMDLEGLERVYRDAPLVAPPSRALRGEALARVATPVARSAAATAILLPFEHLPFWVDLGARSWAFVRPELRIGRFRVERARSRWRDTEALRLLYDVSRLPFRRALYDELKPIAEGLCLGLGGVALERGRGDLFFFLLEERRELTP